MRSFGAPDILISAISDHKRDAGASTRRDRAEQPRHKPTSIRALRLAEPQLIETESLFRQAGSAQADISGTIKFLMIDLGRAICLGSFLVDRVSFVFE
jgi:hypothetical protein